MKKITRVIVCAVAAACFITACGKKPASTPHAGSALPGGSHMSAEQPTTTSNLRVHISDITAYAGDEIDYIGAIQSAENMEINRSMIYVDSSAVDTNTPGIYLAEYSFDYLGSTVTSSVRVTILANPNATTAAPPEETTASVPSASEEAPPETAGETTTPAASSGEEESAAGGDGNDPAANQPTETAAQAPLSTEPVRATVEQALPDATITLSNGKVVTVKCTSSRYIVETFTDESYFEEDGLTFLTSELKVLFNTGEIQVIETVVTRVEPQTAAQSESSENAE